jgi:aryl-alcohol dehydrogenase-like predicted oxidoreductase
MRRVKLGNTGIEVSRLCLGTALVGRLEAKLRPEEFEPVCRRAFEPGVTFFEKYDQLVAD